VTRAEKGSLPGGRRVRPLIALLSLAAMGISILRYAQDLRGRHAALRLATGAGLARTHPEDLQMMALEPGADLAAATAVAALLQGPTVASPGLLRDARDLMLSAAAARPGWAYHRYLLALTDAAGEGSRGRRLLRLAVAGAPGLDAPWAALGEAELAAWSTLTAEERAEAPEVLRRCLASEDFVSARFPAVAAVLGRSRAIALLPEEAGILDAAAGSLAQQNDIPGAALVLSRAERAERRERDGDLAELERRRRLGDAEGARIGCAAWFDQHPFREIDDAAGRAQLARLLALWPGDRFGSWPNDRRARLVRFFLDGRASEIPAQTLSRTIESLTGVPDEVRARVAVLAGNLPAARGIARNASRFGSLEWNPYFLDLARREIAQGRLAEGRAALARLSFSAREGCDALLLRRQLARALRDRAEAAAVEERLAPLRDPSPEDWASRGTLTLCVDPEWGAGRAFEVIAGPGAPAILAYGWDGGRAGTASLPEQRIAFRVPLPALSGQRSLWASFLAGGGSRSLHASFKATP
jgi:hypothetical protein